MSKGTKGWILGAAIGTIVGSVTALLFAPKPGRELRKDIAEGARQVGEKTQEVAEKVSEQSSQLASKVKETAGGLVNEFQAWRATKAGVEQVEKEDVVSPAEAEIEIEPVLDDTAVIGVAEESETVEDPTEEVNPETKDPS